MSNKKISDESVIDAARLLRKGAKMLSLYCPECNFPLFESEGKTFCPNCRREVIIEVGKEEKVQKEEKEIVLESDTLESLEKAIVKVCELITSSKSAEEIRLLSESLEKIANAVEKLRK
ncbi:MAG: Sjogren's syndrome/scleroderma autoantigen 1 family protein [Archaeoglobaceae archaeon]